MSDNFTPETIVGVQNTRQYREDVIERASYRRSGMTGRAIAEFGIFVNHMRAYLTLESVSDSERFQDFQEEMVLRDMWDSQSMFHYYVLFDLFGVYPWPDEEHEIPNVFGLIKKLEERIAEYQKRMR